MREKEKIKVIVINKPSKEEAEKKSKALCEFLEKTWFLPINVKIT